MRIVFKSRPKVIIPNEFGKRKWHYLSVSRIFNEVFQRHRAFFFMLLDFWDGIWNICLFG